MIYRALLVVVFTATSAYADQLTVDQTDPKREGRPPAIIVPYAFSTEALETGLGAVYFRKGVFQPHDGLFLTGYGPFVDQTEIRKYDMSWEIQPPPADSRITHPKVDDRVYEQRPAALLR